MKIINTEIKKIENNFLSPDILFFTKNTIKIEIKNKIILKINNIKFITYGSNS